MITIEPLKKEGEEEIIVEYNPPVVEELELAEEVSPEMIMCARSGMGNCKHTYR